MRTRMRSATWGLLFVTGVGVAAPASAQLQWTSKDEKMNFKIGLLGQMQAEVLIAGQAHRLLPHSSLLGVHQ